MTGPSVGKVCWTAWWMSALRTALIALLCCQARADEACYKSIPMAAGRHVFLTSHTPSLVNETHVTFRLTTCDDVHVVLHAASLVKSPTSSRDVIDIVIGAKNTSRSMIRKCGLPWFGGVTGCVRINETAPGAYGDCREPKTFSLTFGEHVEVWRHVHGARRLYLSAYGLFPARQAVYAISAVQSGNGTSVLEIESRCVNETVGVDLSNLVTRGHLTGAVIAALVCGIILGALGVVYAPRILGCVRGRQLGARERRAETAHTDEEAATLVSVQSPDTAAALTPKSPGVLTPTATATSTSTSFPGAVRVTKPARCGNAYEKIDGSGKGTSAKSDDVSAPSNDVTAKSDDVTAQTDDATTPTGGVPRKGSGVSDRTAWPLPALPSDAGRTGAGVRTGAGAGVGVDTGVSSDEDDNYANADAHIYAGTRHLTPIYENRDAGVYESLTQGQGDKGKR